mgnify:CR=1 FL=1
MTQQFKFGDIVRFNPSNQIGIVVGINEERMKVDFFLENEDGYAPKSFWDCFQLIRAADTHPDTSRLDWLIKTKHAILPGWCGDVYADSREEIDATMRIQAAEAV